MTDTQPAATEKTMLVLQGKRILVVEDNMENLRLFRALLHLGGAIVLEADNARAGLEIAKREQPDMILMDIHMPGMDGLEATRVLRADETTQAIPILAVTASIMPRELDEIINAGCDSYLPKPIEPGSFARQIAAYLRS